MEHAVDLGSRSGDEKPIIFDIVACDSTKQLLKPVLRDGINVFNSHTVLLLFLASGLVCGAMVSEIERLYWAL